jgi:cell wall-associated NlpC family hydrolase
MIPQNHRTLVNRGLAVLLSLAALCLSIVTAPAPSHAAPSAGEVAAAEARLHELERDFEIVSEEYNLVHEKLDDLRARIGSAELVVEKIRARMDTKEEAAVDLATELYMAGGSSGAIEAVLTSDNFADVEERLQYLKTSESEQAKVFDRLAADNALLDSKIETLQEATAEAAQEEQRLAELRSSIDDKVQSQQGEIARLNELIQEAAARREAAEEAAAADAAAAAAAAQEAAAASSSSASGPAPVIAAAPAPNGGAQAAVDAALSQVGKPYQWGASGPDSYDCSGLTMWAWGQAGVSLPHNSGAQYSATPRVAQGDWQPGDLLFYGSPIHHVAMYIGNGQMVEAPYTGLSVRVVSAYRSDYVGAGRPGV